MQVRKLDPDHQPLDHYRHGFLVGGTKFFIDLRYTPFKILGKGSYGFVCGCIDTNTGEKVAIKKLLNPFNDIAMTKRILRETQVLRCCHHPNIITLRDIVSPVDVNEFNDMYFVFDFMEADLHKIIYSSSNRLSVEHIQYFVWQALLGLDHLHSANVVHRDLKPSNLLVNADCRLKICDFGLSRCIHEDDEQYKQLTEYVVTRWYRAPEIMVAVNDYDSKIDLWSLGCILAELFLRRPLFSGDDYVQQINIIFDILGKPTGNDFAWITNKQALAHIKNLPPSDPVPFETVFQNTIATPEALDLLKHLIVFDPRKRYSAKEALNHPFILSLQHLQVDSPTPVFPKFDYEKASIDKLKTLILYEILNFRPHLKKTFMPFIEQQLEGCACPN